MDHALERDEQRFIRGQASGGERRKVFAQLRLEDLGLRAARIVAIV